MQNLSLSHIQDAEYSLNNRVSFYFWLQSHPLCYRAVDTNTKSDTSESLGLYSAARLLHSSGDWNKQFILNIQSLLDRIYKHWKCVSDKNKTKNSNGLPIVCLSFGCVINGIETVLTDKWDNDVRVQSLRRWVNTVGFFDGRIGHWKLVDFTFVSVKKLIDWL